MPLLSQCLVYLSFSTISGCCVFLAIEIDPSTGLTYLAMNYSNSEKEKYLQDKPQDNKQREELEKEAQQFQQTYQFLFMGYELDTCWWEGFVYIRKIAMGAVAVFKNNPFLQVTLALIVLFVSTALHLWYKPYQNDLMDTYETICLLLLTLLFIMGQLTQGSDVHDWYRGPSVLAAMGLFIAWGAVSVIMFFLARKEDSKRLQNENQLKDPATFLQTMGYEKLEDVQADIKSLEDVLDKKISTTVFINVEQEQQRLNAVCLRYKALVNMQRAREEEKKQAELLVDVQAIALENVALDRLSKFEGGSSAITLDADDLI